MKRPSEIKPRLWRILVSAPLLAGGILLIPALAQQTSHAARSEPGDLVKAAQSELNRGNLDKAESSLWPVFSSNPDDDKALLVLGLIRYRQQRYSEAEAVFRRVTQLNRTSGSAHANLARSLVAQNKREESVGEFKQAEALLPGDPGLKAELAQSYAATGQCAAALSILGWISSDKLPASAIPAHIGCLLELGKESEALKEAATNRGPALEAALAEVFVDHDRPQEAQKHLDRSAIAGRHPSARLLYLKGKVLQANGDGRGALDSFRRSLAIDPKSTDTLIAISDAYRADNKGSEAYQLLERARVLDPRSLPVLRRFIVEAVHTHKNAEALAAALELSLMPKAKDEDLYLAGSALLGLEHYAEAAPVLEKYVSQQSQDAKGWLAVGLAHAGLRQFAAAEKDFNQSLQIDTNLSEAEYQLGLMAKNQGQYPSAMEFFGRCVEQQPTNAKCLGALGSLYLQAGLLDKAESALRRSESSNPNNQETEYQLALVLSKLGKHPEAKEHMDRFKKLSATK